MIEDDHVLFAFLVWHFFQHPGGHNIDGSAFIDRKSFIGEQSQPFKPVHSIGIGRKTDFISDRFAEGTLRFSAQKFSSHIGEGHTTPIAFILVEISHVDDRFQTDAPSLIAQGSPEHGGDTG